MVRASCLCMTYSMYSLGHLTPVFHDESGVNF